MRHEGGVLGVRFSANESRIPIWSKADGGARQWDISVDADWPADKIALRVQVETGTILEPTGELEVLPPAVWQEKRWCEYDAIQYRLERITEEQWRTSQRLCRELTEK